MSSSLFCPDNTQWVSMYFSHWLLSSVGMVQIDALNEVFASSNVYTPFQLSVSAALSPKSSTVTYIETHDEDEDDRMSMKQCRMNIG